MNTQKSKESLKDLTNIQRDYLMKICKNIDGLKCMILDSHTSQFISLNFLQSEGFEMEVFLFEDIKNIKDDNLNYVSAVYLITAAQDNLNILCEELKRPHFKDYHIFFLSDVSDDIIRKFAECDENDLIKNMQRLYCNYHAINPELFHSNSGRIISLLNKSIDQWSSSDRASLDLMEESILSALCSIRKIPTIRYLKNSELSVYLADRLSAKFKKLNMTFPSEFEKQRTTLLIIERKEDPFTPLMFHWSYQSMLHEIIGIDSNKIKLKGKEYNLNLQHDDFYAKNLFSNYGEVANNLKAKIEELSSKKKQHKEIKQFEDIQKLLSEMHDFQKDTSITEKHFTFTDEISQQVNRRDLLTISKLEQEIVTKDAKREHYKEIIDVLNNKNADRYDKFRLVALYSLKHQNSELSKELQQFLGQINPKYLEAITKLLDLCGKNQRVAQSLTSNLGEKAFKIYQDYFNNIPNVYEQHVPFVARLAEDALKNKLREDEFPFIDSAPIRDAPNNIVVFIIGGVSYAEAKVFADLNNKYADGYFLIGGSCMVNSNAFLNDYVDLKINNL